MTDRQWKNLGRAPQTRKRASGSCPAPCSAKTWTDEELQWLLKEMETMSKLKESDNRKLLWLAMNTKPWKSLDVVGIESEIFAEIENRLYPEYDGETVTFEEWGWRTPDGDIRYLPNGPDQGRRASDSGKTMNSLEQSESANRRSPASGC